MNQIIHIPQLCLNLLALILTLTPNLLIILLLPPVGFVEISSTSGLNAQLVMLYAINVNGKDISRRCVILLTHRLLGLRLLLLQ